MIEIKIKYDNGLIIKKEFVDVDNDIEWLKDNT